MLAILFVLFSTVNSESGIQVIRYKVPFSFLLTRTILWGNTLTNSTDVDLYSLATKNCGAQMCFVALYRNSTIYQVFINKQNDCGSNPNCVGHSESEYDNSLVFINSSTAKCQNLTNFQNNLAILTKQPVCPANWYSYVRPNGRVWCYNFENRILEQPDTWVDSNNYCMKNYNATLNAFQTSEERNNFIAQLQAYKTKFKSTWIYLGAVRNCTASGPCGRKLQFKWIGGTSTNNTVANDRYDSRFWDSGNCLTMMLTGNYFYDDVHCSQEAVFTCGKYAAV